MATTTTKRVSGEASGGQTARVTGTPSGGSTLRVTGTASGGKTERVSGTPGGGETKRVSSTPGISGVSFLLLEGDMQTGGADALMIEGDEDGHFLLEGDEAPNDATTITKRVTL